MFDNEELKELKEAGALNANEKSDFDTWFENVCFCAREHLNRNAESLRYEFMEYYDHGVPAFVAALEMFCERAD